MRYYFHLRDGAIEEDMPTLMNLAGIDAVRAEALLAARDMVAWDVRRGILDLRCRIDVADAGGRIVHSLAFAEAVEIRGG